MVLKQTTKVARTYELGQSRWIYSNCETLAKIDTYRDNKLVLLYNFICIYGKQWISILVMKEVKSKIATQFKILERSEKASTKILARNKDSELQKHVS